MDGAASGRTWDEASSPTAVGMARRFEAAWRGSGSSATRPDPADFLDQGSPDRAGARLALLRADLGLRWEAGERIGASWYRDRYPDLDDDTLVALVYEEFCLHEEEYGTAEPQEFYRRYADVASKLRRVLDIHGLVGSGASTALHFSEPDAVEFPEAGQTIAGFRLVEELGRGSFARVFRAEERQLADRPVALKVARKGSREPQTLARLQHTHIVPVHSYRTDPATGLHLLCMPYFGRVTLAQLLDDPTVQSALTGAQVLDALDRLDPTAANGKPRKWGQGHQAFAALSYPYAIAWWGARLAEALQHAHERGVLHRDLKPSNVLVTSDGMPMLLDFNLAQADLSGVEGLEPAALGGTLAYMAPEHLEALAEGDPDRVDARADIYALGVVLFEAMGTRPFPGRPEAKAKNVAEVLYRAAEQRRGPVPRLRDAHPEAPPELEAVVRACLAPDPADRYPDAASLAADLQAVVEGSPLRFAREPILSRSRRWVIQKRRKLAVAFPIVATPIALALGIAHSMVAEMELKTKVGSWLQQGKLAEQADRHDLAASHYKFALSLTEGRPGLSELRAEANQRARHVQVTKEVHAHAERLFRIAEPLRFALLGFDGSGQPGPVELKAVLAPFFVLESPNWTDRPELSLLDEARRARLVREVEELLFFWAIGAAAAAPPLVPSLPDDPGVLEPVRTALTLCDKAIKFAASPGPWLALRERCLARLERRDPQALPLPDPKQETSAWACFQRALIGRRIDGEEPQRVIAWLDQAVRLDPSHYWAQYYLAFYHEDAGQTDLALAHYMAAVALRPDAPFALFNRAHLYWQRGAWERALADIGRALELARDFPFDKARLELALVRHRLGDTRARDDLLEVIRSAGRSSPLGRAARIELAMLDVNAGQFAQARSLLDALIAEAPDEPEASSARLARAEIALRLGRPAEAEADLTGLLAQDSDVAEYHALRALALLAMDRGDEALAEAEAAHRLDPMPSRDRLLARALLAAGRVDELRIDRPSILLTLPGQRFRLRDDLRAAARHLAEGPPDPARLRCRAALLAALGDPEAEAVAAEALAFEPASVTSRLLRARVRRMLGNSAGALSDIQAGLEIAADDPRLYELRGLIALEAGEPLPALADFDLALALGGSQPLHSLHSRRARALMSLGLAEQALSAWNLHLEDDPEDAAGYLGRSRAWRRLGLPIHALADLEKAADESTDCPDLLARIFLDYALGLPEWPDRLPRVLALGRRVLHDVARQAVARLGTPAT